MNENTKRSLSLGLAAFSALFFLCLTGCREVPEKDSAKGTSVEAAEKPQEDEGIKPKPNMASAQGKVKTGDHSPTTPDGIVDQPERSADIPAKEPATNDRIQRGRRR